MNLEQQQFYNYLQASFTRSMDWLIGLQNIDGKYLWVFVYGLVLIIFVVVSITLILSKDKE